MYKQISYISFKNEITDKHDIYLNDSKQMTDVKLWLLFNNTWNQFTEWKQMNNSK